MLLSKNAESPRPGGQEEHRGERSNIILFRTTIWLAAVMATMGAALVATPPPASSSPCVL